MFPFHPSKLDRRDRLDRIDRIAFSASASAPIGSAVLVTLGDADRAGAVLASGPWFAASFEGPARPAPVGTYAPQNTLEAGPRAALRTKKGFSHQGGRGTPRDLTPR
jgi:hypothetical protein